MTDRRFSMMTPSICFVTTTSVTLEAFVLPSAEYLHRVAGFDVTLVAAPNDDFTDRLPDWAHYVPVDMKRGIDPGFLWSVGRLVRLFRKKRFDIVQFSTPNASLYASLAAAIVRVPVRLYAQWGIRYVGFNGARRTLFKSIERVVCRLATHVEPDSFGNLDFSTSEGLYPPNKGHVIWNGSAGGVDLDRFDVSRKSLWRREVRAAYAIPDEAFVVGFVGRLCRDKGGNELLLAMRDVLATIEGSRLVLVGSVEEEGLDADLLLWARSHPRVIFTGQTPDVPQHLAALDTFVLPSYREGFGSVVIEAEAMGVPVIVTDIPGPLDAMLPDVTGLVVPVRDSEALVAAITGMNEDPTLRERFGEAGHVFAHDRFARPEFWARLVEHRTSLVGGRPADATAADAVRVRRR